MAETVRTRGSFCVFFILLWIQTTSGKQQKFGNVLPPEADFSYLEGLGPENLPSYLRQWVSKAYFKQFVSRYVQSTSSADVLKTERVQEEHFHSEGLWTTRGPAPVSPGVKNDTSCTSDMAWLVEGLMDNETWALQMWDSWGKPGPGLLQGWFYFGGGYDECRAVTTPEDADFDGNYCLSLIFTQAFPLPIRWGTCMPTTCSEDLITKFLSDFISSYNLTSVYVKSTECRGESRDFSTASLLAVLAASVIAIMVLAGTTYDLVFLQLPRWLEGRDRHSKIVPTSPTDRESPWTADKAFEDSRDDRSYEKSDSFGTLHETPHYQDVIHNTLLAFSVYHNACSVLSTHQPNGIITCLHGIRFFSMTWVVLIHMYSQLNHFAENILSAKVTKSNFLSIAFNGTVCVDTFFTMSGFVLGYLKIKEYKEKGFVIKWRYFYFHRLWRLAPPYMLYLLFILGLTRFFGSGAQWSEKQPLDQENCENYWWTNLLFINNFVHWDKICIMQSWFLSDDFQFHIVSPLLFTPFFLSRYAGFLVCGGALVACWTYTFVMAMINDWRLVDFREVSRDRLHNYYYSPFCRIAPFIIGIMAGFVLANNKGRIKLPKRWMAPLAWVAAFTIGILVVFGVHGDVTGDDYSSKGVAAIYLAFARSGWSAAICWMILACASGYGGPINAFLSWKPFLIMSRLSYTAYLIHINVLNVYMGNINYPFFINAVSIGVMYTAVVFVTLLLSFFLVVTIEIPLIGLEQVLLGPH